MLGLVMILSLSCLLAYSLKAAHGVPDWITPSMQRLWTTNATGLEEINLFMAGDPVYLKTTGANYPLQPGNYTLYIFEGNLNVSDGKSIPSGFGIPIVTMNISTDSMGRFGQTTPILIWNSATGGNFTIILDQAFYLESGHYYASPGYGVWDDSRDYRDDLCTEIPTPPSFRVIPQVPFGTVTAMLSLFCGLGLFVRMKKNRNSG